MFYSFLFFLVETRHLGPPPITRAQTWAHDVAGYLRIQLFRPGHTCEFAVTVAAILMFDAISSDLSDKAYLAVLEFNMQNLGMINTHGNVWCLHVEWPLFKTLPLLMARGRKNWVVLTKSGPTWNPKIHIDLVSLRIITDYHKFHANCQVFF